MGFLTQIIEITLMNLRNLPARLGASMVIIVGIAGVVTVLVALLAMANGFEATLKGSGETDRAIVLREGSNDEMSSQVSDRVGAYIRTFEGIERDDDGALGAVETYVIADIRKRSNDSEANLPIRGVEARSFDIRDEVKIVEGRGIGFGKAELVAGIGAADQFKGLDLGKTVKIRSGEWTVVGFFEAGGGVHESEVWVDNKVLHSTLNRGGQSTSMIVKLDSPLDFDQFAARLESDKQISSKAVREKDYYSRQSVGLTELITQFGYTVGFIMAVGAIFGALNTMYSAVSTRSVEIATLRALGFGRTPIVASVMVEALILAMIGGAIGAAIAYAVFNGYTVSTMNNATFSQVAFDFEVSLELLQRGIVWACMLGLIGGMFPAIRAARQPITIALRGM